jgi:SagB-type dehydrogenase family enzyme
MQPRAFSRLAALVLFAVPFTVACAADPPPLTALPAPDTLGQVTLARAIETRRSVREYAPGALTLAEVAQLMWAAQGITGADEKHRAVPSARAVHPLEVRLEARRVDGLAPGLYVYRPKEHALALVAAGDQKAAVMGAAGQPCIDAAAAVVCVTGDSALTAAKYGRNAERWLGMEAGFVVQNVYLTCTSLGLGTVMVGGYDEPKANVAFRLAPGWKTLGLLPIGRRK